jgi:hypothetical protein
VEEERLARVAHLRTRLGAAVLREVGREVVLDLGPMLQNTFSGLSSIWWVPNYDALKKIHDTDKNKLNLIFNKINIWCVQVSNPWPHASKSIQMTTMLPASSGKKYKITAAFEGIFLRRLCSTRYAIREIDLQHRFL